MSSDATFSHKNAGDIDNERLEKVGPIDLPFKLKKDALRVILTTSNLCITTLPRTSIKPEHTYGQK